MQKNIVTLISHSLKRQPQDAKITQQLLVILIFLYQSSENYEAATYIRWCIKHEVNGNICMTVPADHVQLLLFLDGARRNPGFGGSGSTIAHYDTVHG